jgi:hypothetical protein
MSHLLSFMSSISSLYGLLMSYKVARVNWPHYGREKTKGWIIYKVIKILSKKLHISYYNPRKQDLRG